MNTNTILMLGIAVGSGLAIYFIYQEIKANQRKMQALENHMGKLNSLVWTYNIGRRPPAFHGQHHDEMTDTDMETDELESDDDDSADEQHLPHHPLGEHAMQHLQHSHSLPPHLAAGMPHVIFESMSISASRPSSSPHQPPIVEEISEEEEPNPESDRDQAEADAEQSTAQISAGVSIGGAAVASATLPSVVSFDTRKSTASREEPEEDLGEGGEQSESGEGSDDDETETDMTPAAAGSNRVYADNAKNRRLGRVGQAY